MVKKQACHLVWFRHDLRVTDNKALSSACADPEAKVLALFTATPEQWRAHDLSSRQITFLHQNLLALRDSLAKLGIPLICQTVADFSSAAHWVVEFAQQQQADHLYFNRQYELNERKRDEWLLKQTLPFHVHTFDDALLLPPQSVTNQKGEMYQVYTPFRRAFISQLITADFRSLAAPKPRDNALKLQTLSQPLFEHHAVDIAPHFPAGEAAALQQLRQFCRTKVQHYQQQRDIPAIDGTSQLSPYLAIGVLSPRQCLNRLLAENPHVFDSPDSGAFTWLNELIWREFYHHLLVAFPRLCRHQPFIEWTTYIQWNTNNTDLNAWQNGQTGYPIVDAAMRQLNATGWMHNRLRMITASFLVKDLLIDWRLGERYFMQQLIDGTLAANNGGWQWSASTGTDAQPWFRIFNPTTQGKKFDPQGEFIRQWLPELSSVPDKYIHTPHEWAEANNLTLDYPAPIVDHKQARLATLAAFEAGKNDSIKTINDQSNNLS
ncbi:MULTISPECIES: deoxyribodipyrimidine photo-lyase [Providencia]|uniref:Deoxyribodipyrimidine photo-lyase n=1 Tax=Providencia stuartii TaxID=588 RepID=A0AAI9HY97_PROST|nr:MULTISPECIES: deoxyribodipyrimidine photo-lyase [Providencia]ELR5042845.1 deoxyribodipyrimidine photo-lyase [Providencia rettgeri]ELR5034788.1 deoxyribodipyrimidine photo-lyase [Providencia stuartii]ELR5122491.1 deoxyribodipyrimidine photo-lyase [Providencia stuartii]ELR5292784.1 deoxyribodipyrimidine photo-lyase [Providencia stuartii]MBG5920473.1 deoxyribodipyrimidine photo-lyase [Providencia stuartii]